MIKKKKIIQVINADGSVSHILEGARVTSIDIAERLKREEYDRNAEAAVAEAVYRHRPWGMVVSKHEYGYHACLGISGLYRTPCWHADYSQLSIEELKEIAGWDWKARNNLKYR